MFIKSLYKSVGYLWRINSRHKNDEKGYICENYDDSEKESYCI